MKRILTLALVALFAFSAAACGDKTADSKTDTSSSAASQVETKADADKAVETTAETEDYTQPRSGAASSATSTVVTDGSKLGELQPVQKYDDYVINGLILTSDSGHHDYGSLEENVAKGYLTTGLHSEYMMNEWIGVYGDTDASMFNIYVVPNDPDAYYEKYTDMMLEKECEEKGFPIIKDIVPDKENSGHFENFYINPDSGSPGLYNVFFVKDHYICYMVQLNIVPDKAE